MARKMRTVVADVQAVAPGSFPIDMLRRDHCWPRTEDDASKITGTFDQYRVDEKWAAPREIIQVACMSDRPRDSVFTTERWRSFGWEITKITEYPY